MKGRHHKITTKAPNAQALLGRAIRSPAMKGFPLLISGKGFYIAIVDYAEGKATVKVQTRESVHYVITDI